MFRSVGGELGAQLRGMLTRTQAKVYRVYRQSNLGSAVGNKGRTFGSERHENVGRRESVGVDGSSNWHVNCLIVAEKRRTSILELCGSSRLNEKAVSAEGIEPSITDPQRQIRARPDVIILDITMPDMSGLEAASRIAKMRLGYRLLTFTMHESELTDDIRQTGLQGLVLKTRAASDLIRGFKLPTCWRYFL
jgi:CheY-like chemotaxis protein